MSRVSLSKSSRAVLVLGVVGVWGLACAGTPKDPVSPNEDVDQIPGPVEEEPPLEDVDAAPMADGAPVDAPVADAMPDAAPPAVSFVLENHGKTDLSFAVDKGWQPVLFAYSGKPPKAKSMFQRGLEIEPQNQRLREALAQLP